jgi:processive 1,2-diacylglycerol beta-glucosyltransferase
MGTGPKILILYASYGDGHIQVSKALHQRFNDRGITNVRMVDLYAAAHPIINAITRYVYLKSSALFPRLYGWSYDMTANMHEDQKIGKWLNSFSVRKLKEIIQQERPDAVINTFPMMAMPELRRKTGLFIPTYTVLTDFVLHRRWIHTETERYFVATENLKNKVVAEGIPAERVTVSGIPIRKKFTDPVDQRSIYEKYGLDRSKKNILVMAGAYGVLRNLKKMIQSMISLEDVRVLVVCGKNKSLRANIENDFAGDDRVRIFDFVENMQELMVISSCMITKAGGITLAEALTMELPIVVFRPLPGQEKGNALFLSESGKASIANSISDMKKQVQAVLAKDFTVKAHNKEQGNLRSADPSDAAALVVRDVLGEIEAFESLDRTRMEVAVNESSG